LVGIELKDDRLGTIATEISLAKGETKKITKKTLAIETVTSFAEASGLFYVGEEKKYVKANACVTVKVT